MSHRRIFKFNETASSMHSLSIKSLQEFCLDLVIKNFSRFMSDYDSETGVIPRMYFEFLQRKFSQFLLDSLQKSEIYIFWSYLLNPHLKKVNLSSFTNSPSACIIDRLEDCGQNIETLDLRRITISGRKIASILRSVPNVQELYLSGTRSNNKILKIIGDHCPHIRILDMTSCKITAVGLASLCKEDETKQMKPNIKLEELYIANCGGSDDTVVFALKHFPSLKILDHDCVVKVIYEAHHSEMVNGSPEELPIYNLTTLQLTISDLQHWNFITDALNVCSVVCPFVSMLTVNNIRYQTEILACSKFPNLKNIKLSGPQFSPVSDMELLLESTLTNVGDVDYNDLLVTRGQSLVSLELHTGTLSIELLSNSCSNLENLTLDDIAFDNFSKNLFQSHPTAFPKLKTLTLQNLFFDQQTQEYAVFFMHSSPKLENLSFPHCRFIDDSFVTNLRTCKCINTIRKLDFSASNVKIHPIRELLFAIPKLENMIVGSHSVSKHQFSNLVTAMETENRPVHLVYMRDDDSSSGTGSDYSGDDMDIHTCE